MMSCRFLPILSLGGDIKVGLIDHVIKIVGGAVTFGLTFTRRGYQGGIDSPCN